MKPSIPFAGEIDKAVERCKAVDVFPDGLVIRMKDVRAVAVDLDAFDRFGIDVAADVCALVQNKDRFPLLQKLLRRDRAEQSGAHDQAIHPFHPALLSEKVSGTQAASRKGSFVVFRVCASAGRLAQRVEFVQKLYFRRFLCPALFRRKL